MHVEFVTVDGEKIMGMDTDCVFPAKGDVLSAPDGRVFVIVQRTFITNVLPSQPGKIVDLSAPREVGVYMQCLLQPVKGVGDPNAIKS